MTATLTRIYIFQILARTKEVQIFKGSVRKRGPEISASAFDRSLAFVNVA